VESLAFKERFDEFYGNNEKEIVNSYEGTFLEAASQISGSGQITSQITQEEGKKLFEQYKNIRAHLNNLNSSLGKLQYVLETEILQDALGTDITGSNADLNLNQNDVISLETTKKAYFTLDESIKTTMNENYLYQSSKRTDMYLDYAGYGWGTVYMDISWARDPDIGYVDSVAVLSNSNEKLFTLIIDKSKFDSAINRFESAKKATYASYFEKLNGSTIDGTEIFAK
jgi:hypothetical protein